MDFQTCAVEQVQTQFHEAGVAYVSGTLGNCPFDLLAYCAQNLWNIALQNNSIKDKKIMELHTWTRAKGLLVCANGWVRFLPSLTEMIKSVKHNRRKILKGILQKSRPEVSSQDIIMYSVRTVRVLISEQDLIGEKEQS